MPYKIILDYVTFWVLYDIVLYYILFVLCSVELRCMMLYYTFGDHVILYCIVLYVIVV